MRRLLTYMLFMLPSICFGSISYTFSFDGREKDAIQMTEEMVYSPERGYGYDFVDLVKTSPLIPSRFQGEKSGRCGTSPFFLSVDVPDGNYKVTVTLGSKKQAGNTVVRAESRRLFLQDIETRKGQFVSYSFIVNKRNTEIWGKQGESEELKVVDRVRIKKREEGKLNWDDKLTIEVSGESPTCSSIKIETADESVPTVFLCGNSTVVDQDYEPWASWGQMIPCWFDENVAFANYAESGETASTFIAAGRLKKILSVIKGGDYVFVEFGHNDQKQKFAGAGAWYNFSMCLKQFIDEVRHRDATIVFVTPTQRRSFDDEGHIQETHGDYPDAMRAVAQREDVPVIELHDMTRTFYETLGVENSKKAFVHYPANTYPGQDKPLADNTHFNPYGAYELSKMMVEGMKKTGLPIVQHLRNWYHPFNEYMPDDFNAFHWVDSPFTETLKPDGN